MDYKRRNHLSWAGSTSPGEEALTRKETAMTIRMLIEDITVRARELADWSINDLRKLLVGYKEYCLAQIRPWSRGRVIETILDTEFNLSDDYRLDVEIGEDRPGPATVAQPEKKENPQNAN